MTHMSSSCLCMQMGAYMVTLIFLNVTTLSACLQTISKSANLKDPEDLQQAVMWKLRQYLAFRAAKDADFPISVWTTHLGSVCPAFDPSACDYHPSIVQAIMTHVRLLLMFYLDSLIPMHCCMIQEKQSQHELSS